MKRLMACVSLAAAGATAALPAHGAQTQKAAAKAAPHRTAAVIRKCKVAPADEYFGRLKMSILGIRNTIKDQGLRAEYEPDKAPSTLGTIALAEDAIRDWEHKYPCDSWLPGTIYALQHFYGKIHTADGVKHVHATFAWLRKDYPRSAFVRTALREDGQAAVTPPPPTGAPVVSAPAVGAPGGAPPSGSGAAAPASTAAPATPK